MTWMLYFCQAPTILVRPPLDSDELIWPFLQIIVAADDADFEAWGNQQFATDRRRRPKGVVEVIL
jgi:hypothetical protein